MMEAQRLSWVLRNQKVPRDDNYNKLDDAICRGGIDPPDTSTNVGIKAMHSPFNICRWSALYHCNTPNSTSVIRAIGPR